VLCSGKIYYDLIEDREKREIKDVAVIRVEQLAPFPTRTLSAEFKKYSKADVVWCQEEPQNMGAWTFVAPRIEDALGDIKHAAARPRYVGRKASASTSTGSAKTHQREQAALVKTALVG
jgi:2-oxoglutarate dehydrogenase E1 component